MNDDDTGTDIYLPWEIRMNRERTQERYKHWGLWLLAAILAPWVVIFLAVYAVLP
jgi:hypothetical protein